MTVRSRFIVVVAALLTGGGALGCRGSAVATAGALPETTASACVSSTTPFVGTICAPTEAGRHPAILLLGGWPGGDVMRDAARRLGGRGYVAASVVYFGSPGTQPTLVAIPVELVGRAIRAIVGRPDVDPDRLAVLGISKGGELALLAAATYPELKAVIADVPAPFAWFGLGESGRPTGCSWARAGEPVACVPQDQAAGKELGRQFARHQPIVLRPMYDASATRADPAVMKAAFFPLEQIAGPVLCLAGDDDQVWSSRRLCESTMGYLRDRHHPYADRMISYPGAGHLFLLAQNGPSSARNTVPLSSSHDLQIGGTPEADARAAVAAWTDIEGFLAAAWRRSQ